MRWAAAELRIERFLAGSVYIGLGEMAALADINA